MSEHFTLTIALGFSFILNLIFLWAFAKKSEKNKIVAAPIAQEKSPEVTRLKAALERSNDAITLIDNRGSLIYINPTCIRMLGLTQDEVNRAVGDDWVNLHASDLQHVFITDALPSLRNRNHWHSETVLTAIEGVTRTIEHSLTRLSDDMGLLHIMRDVSPARMTEQKLQHMRQQFFQSQKMESLGRLAGGIAHDFNNILSSISGYTEFLQQDLPKNSAEHGFADKISRGVEQAKALVNRMLLFTRANTNTNTACDLVEVVKEAETMLRAGFHNNINIVTNTLAPTCLIPGNSVQLTQVLMNLGVNAHDAMENGGTLTFNVSEILGADIPLPNQVSANKKYNPETLPTIHIERLSNTHNRASVGSVQANIRYAVLSVSDTGTGISDIVLEHMFEPFFTTKEIGKGTGLGLATVYALTLDHDGALQIDTTMGQGTIFNLFFPLYGEEKVAEKSPFTKVTLPQNDDILPPTKAILVVDDQTEVRGIICAMLERAGYTVCDSPNALEAIELIRENTDTFAAVVTDYSMPEMDGLELAEEIFLLRPTLPILLISGFAQFETLEKIKSSPNIKDFLGKPVQNDELLSKIRKLLNH